MKKNIYYLIILVITAIIGCDGNTSDSTGTTGKGGSMARFTINGNYLYTVSNSDLSVFDITNEKTPESVNKITLPGFIETIFSRDTTLFFGTRQGMLIYDNSNPLNPEFISEYSHIYSCDPVVVSDKYAYVTMNSESSRCGRQNNRLDIIDISNLSNPDQVAEYEMTAPRGLGIDFNTLFLCDDGLKVYDVSDPQNIELKNHFQVDAYDVIPDDGYHLVMIGADGFFQYEYVPGEEKINLLSSIEVD